MEKQWRDAIEALDNDKLSKQVTQLQQQVNDQNKAILALKKENQQLAINSNVKERLPVRCG